VDSSTASRWGSVLVAWDAYPSITHRVNSWELVPESRDHTDYLRNAVQQVDPAVFRKFLDRTGKEFAFRPFLGLPSNDGDAWEPFPVSLRLIRNRARSGFYRTIHAFLQDIARLRQEFDSGGFPSLEEEKKAMFLEKLNELVSGVALLGATPRRSTRASRHRKRAEPDFVGEGEDEEGEEEEKRGEGKKREEEEEEFVVEEASDEEAPARKRKRYPVRRSKAPVRFIPSPKKKRSSSHKRSSDSYEYDSSAEAEDDMRLSEEEEKERITVRRSERVRKQVKAPVSQR
jgi:hypothetical protein